MGTARVLITGIGGFVGHHLARHLAQRGDIVLGAGIEEVPPETRSFLAGSWHADVRHEEALSEMLAEARPEAIVHLAAQSSGAWSLENPIPTFEINALGTFRLLEAIRRATPHARVLVVGTGDAYGPQPEGTRVSEDALSRPMNPYALSKAAADGIAELCGRMWELDIVRTRSFAHMGPGQTIRFAIPSWCRQIAEIEMGASDPVLRVGNLDVTRDVTDVRDVVKAYVRLIERGRSRAAYNVCSGVGTRLDAVVESLRQRSHVPIRVEVAPALVRAADLPYLVGDPTRIHEDTGWQPMIPLERALEETLEDWRLRLRAGGGPQ